MDKDQKKDQKKEGQTIETDGLKEDPGVKGAAPDAEKRASKQEKHFRDRIPNNHRYSVISFYVVFTVVVIFILIRIGDNLDKIALALGAGFHWMRRGVSLDEGDLCTAGAGLCAGVSVRADCTFFQAETGEVSLLQEKK